MDTNTFITRFRPTGVTLEYSAQWEIEGLPPPYVSQVGELKAHHVRLEIKERTWVTASGEAIVDLSAYGIAIGLPSAESVKTPEAFWLEVTIVEGENIQDAQVGWPANPEESTPLMHAIRGILSSYLPGATFFTVDISESLGGTLTASQQAEVARAINETEGVKSFSISGEGISIITASGSGFISWSQL